MRSAGLGRALRVYCVRHSAGFISPEDESVRSAAMTPRNFTRRRLLCAAGATALGFTGLRSLLARGASAVTQPVGTTPTDQASGYGPLVRDPHKILDLPQGFSYRVISREGERMDDGLRVPGNCDGTAAFA